MHSYNKGEWSEPYVVVKLLADGKLHLGNSDFEKIEDAFYPLLKIIRNEGDEIIEYYREGGQVKIDTENGNIGLPISAFEDTAKKYFQKIQNAPTGSGAFSLPQIESFLKSILITSFKAKSKDKNDVTIQIQDLKSLVAPVLGFSVKSQLGAAATLVNASGATNFTYKLIGRNLADNERSEFAGIKLFSKKIEYLNKLDVSLFFESVDSPIFNSNLQTIDYKFKDVLARVLLLYFSESNSSEKTVYNLIEKVALENPLEYDLDVNPRMYELMIRRFLVEYALGMRASEVWTRHYQANGGYLIVRKDGELLCYHFYFAEQFEKYLLHNTRLDTPSKSRHKFGNIYQENGTQKVKLNLQIRFIQ